MQKILGKIIHRKHSISTANLGVLYRLLSLVHGTIFGRDDEDDDIGDVGASSSHRRKGRVSGRVEESDARAGRRQNNGKGADVLSYAAELLTGKGDGCQ